MRRIPVQLPTKYQMIINLKVAKTLDLGVPAEPLARADEVIEQVFRNVPIDGGEMTLWVNRIAFWRAGRCPFL
jgi:hypothetical protein